MLGSTGTIVDLIISVCLNVCAWRSSLYLPGLFQQVNKPVPRIIKWHYFKQVFCRTENRRPVECFYDCNNCIGLVSYFCTEVTYFRPSDAVSSAGQCTFTVHNLTYWKHWWFILRDAQWWQAALHQSIEVQSNTGPGLVTSNLSKLVIPLILWRRSDDKLLQSMMSWVQEVSLGGPLPQQG